MSESQQIFLKPSDTDEITIDKRLTDFCSFEPILKRGPKGKHNIPKFQTELTLEQVTFIKNYFEKVNYQIFPNKITTPLQNYNFQDLVNKQDFEFVSQFSQEQIFELINLFSQARCHHLIQIFSVYIACQLKSNTLQELQSLYAVQLNDSQENDDQIRIEFENKKFPF